MVLAMQAYMSTVVGKRSTLHSIVRMHGLDTRPGYVWTSAAYQV
jgi:hypothetical protein